MKSNDLAAIIEQAEGWVGKLRALKERHDYAVKWDPDYPMTMADQDAGYTAVDMTTAAAKGFRDGVASILVQPFPAERDSEGWWSHPHYLSEFDDEVSQEQFDDWCRRHQVETKITHMESDVDFEVFDAYMTDGQVDCSAWEIRHPDDAGWFILSIHDTEDGPVCVWGRRLEAAGGKVKE